MLPSFCNQEVIRLRPGTKEERGSTIPDWSKVDSLVITGCSVQPATTSMSLDGRVMAITDQLTAYLPEGSDVKAGDRIVFEGDTYEISGDPKAWKAVFRLSNIQLNLIRWRG